MHLRGLHEVRSLVALAQSATHFSPRSMTVLKVHLLLSLAILPFRKTVIWVVRGHGTVIWERPMAEGESQSVVPQQSSSSLFSVSWILHRSMGWTPTH